MSRKPRIDTKDIIGERFSDLTVIKPIRPGKYRGVSYLCQCDCGTSCEVYGGHLRAGMRHSCGCRSKKRIQDTAIDNIMRAYKRKCKDKGREFNLTRDQFTSLIFKNCSYCGMAPVNRWRQQHTKKILFAYNGIDRMDANKGYSLDNCVASCLICNRVKSDMTFEDFKDHVKRMYTCLWINS